MCEWVDAGDTPNRACRKQIRTCTVMGSTPPSGERPPGTGQKRSRKMRVRMLTTVQGWGQARGTLVVTGLEGLGWACMDAALGAAAAAIAVVAHAAAGIKHKG